MALTKISVIIPTFNAATMLEAQIEALCDQDYPPEQILVIDSSSTDGTADLARQLKVDLITIETGSFDHGATRNLGVDHTTGDVLIFMTQDALPLNRETIGKLVMPLHKCSIVVSYARQIPAEKASPNEKYLRLANYPPVTLLKSAEDIPVFGIKTFRNSNVCAAYRRLEFEALGRFPSPVVCNEDMLFAARAIFAGYKVAYSADALVSHTHYFNASQLFRRYFDIAVSLDHEPRVKALGKTEAKGFDFFKNQLVFIRDQKKYHQIPLAIIESGAKYLGFKIGENHNCIPKRFKKHFSTNKAYWLKIEKKSRKKVSAY